LPWRRTRDPYSVWVAEIMLQQTRIDQGTPYFERFTAAFPTVHALAAAKEDVDLESALRRAPVQTRAMEFVREAGGAVPLRDLAAAMSAMSCFISADAGPMHLASAR